MFHLGDDGSIKEDVGDFGYNHEGRCYGEPHCYCSFPEIFTYELRLLVKQKNVTKAMDELKKAFSRIDPKVNESCGLHVHLDMRNRDRLKCFNNLVNSQDILYSMQSSERRHNDYCRRQNIPDWDHGLEHHLGISSDAYQYHKTIEVRVHEGCVDANKIGNWIKILTKIVDYGHKFDTIKDEGILIKKLRIPKKARLYIQDSIKRNAA